MIRYVIFTAISSLLITNSCIAQSPVKCSDEGIYTVEGTLKTNSETAPEMTLDFAATVKPGEKGELEKYFESTFLGAKMNGWLTIATVEVKSVKDKVVKFAVLETHSEMTVNGKKKNQFEAGRKVKFTRYDYGVPVLDSSNWSPGKPRYTGKMVCGKPTGEWVYYHENGQVEKRIYFNEKGERDGRYEEFYIDGTPKIRGSFKDEKEDGEWTGFHPNGQKSLLCTYKDGMITGKLTTWYENGKLKDESEYDYAGKRKGTWKSYYQDGNIREQKTYNYNGELDGKWTNFYQNGKTLNFFTYSAGKRNGECGEFFENGNPKTTGNYSFEKREGTWTTYSEDGKKLSEKNYSHDKLNGQYRTWYANGNPEQSGSYGDDEKAGKWETYYENGQLHEMKYYTAARYDGASEEYYENGQLKSKGSYTLGVENGHWEYYYENGKKQAAGSYDHGKKTGKWLSWDEAGKKHKEKF